MRKGITPVVATILLLIIAVAVVGLAYGFITGFFSTVTGKAAIVSGASSCNSNGYVTIRITNAGTGNIADSDIKITRTSCVQRGSNGCASTGPTFSATADIGPGASGSKAETTTIPTTHCKAGNTCFYDVVVGGVIFPTQAVC